MRREVPDGVVAPVVGLAALGQEGFGDAVVHGQQLDGGHAERGEVGQGGIMGQPGIAAANRLGHVWVGRREALDMHLVQHRVLVGVARTAPLAPGEDGIDDKAARNVDRRVQWAGPVRIGRVVAEDFRSEPDLAVDGPRVRVEQQLRRVVAHPAGRVPRPGDPVAVGLPRSDARHEPVPHPGVVLRQGDPGLRAAVVEQAQLHRVAAGRHGEVRPAVPRNGAQREHLAR